MNKTFPIQVGQEVFLLPEGNARYLYKANLQTDPPTPIRATITSIGRIYFHVALSEYNKTRFQKTDFSCHDTDDNTRYRIFQSETDFHETILKEKSWRELQQLAARAYSRPDEFQQVSLQQLLDFLAIMKQSKEGNTP